MAGKAVFLDRDGTLIEDIGYMSDPEQINLLPAVPKALIELREMGYKLVVVTNQSAVAQGIISEQVLSKIHDRLNQLLTAKKARLDRIYYCPYHPDGAVQKYRKQSQLRKPNNGMLLKAAKEMDIDLSQSWMIGDAYSDVTAGYKAGCKTILLNTPTSYKHPVPGDATPDYKAVNITEAVNIIKSRNRTFRRITSRTDAEPDTQPASLIKQPQPVIDEHTPQPPHTQPISTPSELTDEDSTKQLLREILNQLKSTKRAEMFHEFSAMKLIAGILQIFVVFCLLIGIWFLMGPGEQTSKVFVSLGFTAVFQLMALTLYIMHDGR